jgi:hypothetical protein
MGRPLMGAARTKRIGLGPAAPALQQPLASFNGSQEITFDEKRRQCGTIEGYFSEGLAIDAGQQKARRDLYLGTQ